MQKKSYKQAVKYYKQAYDKSIEIENLTYITDILEELQNCYKYLHDYKNAFETAELYIFFNDSISGIETQKQLSTLETIYQTEKKEQEIERQKLEITAQKAQSKSKDLKIRQARVMIVSASVVLLLLGILSIVLFKSIKAKKKANVLLKSQKKEIEEKNEELNQLIEEVTTQKEEILKQRDIAQAQKEEIISSITYAKRIQQAVLPAPEYIAEILPEHFILFKPQNIVSGDFYWIKKINNYVITVAADSTGHGVPGAFMSMLGSSFLNEVVTYENLNDSGEILNKLRNKVKNSLHQTGQAGEQKDGMDIAFCIIDTESLELQYSGAYNPLYIIRTALHLANEPVQEFMQLKANRQPIAIYLKETDFETQRFKLQKGDCLYTFSDGFIDQFGGEKGGKFKSENFKNLLLKISQKPMAEQKQILDKTLTDWIGTDYEQIDDVLVMGVKI